MVHGCRTKIFYMAARGARQAHQMSRAPHCEAALQPAELLRMRRHQPADLLYAACSNVWYLVWGTQLSL